MTTLPPLTAIGTVISPFKEKFGTPRQPGLVNTTVGRIHHYDARTGEVTVWAEPPGSVDVPVVHTRQVAYESADGTTVRMFVISSGAEPDRPRPTMSAPSQQPTSHAPREGPNSCRLETWMIRRSEFLVQRI